MTVIPAVLVLIVGSRVVLTAVDRWFNTPVDEILSSANSIAADYYQERQRAVSDSGGACRATGRAGPGGRRCDATCGRWFPPSVTGRRPGLVQVYRVSRSDAGTVSVVPVVDVGVADHAARLGARLGGTAGGAAPSPAANRRRGCSSR